MTPRGGRSGRRRWRALRRTPTTTVFGEGAGRIGQPAAPEISESGEPGSRICYSLLHGQLRFGGVVVVRRTDAMGTSSGTRRQQHLDVVQPGEPGRVLLFSPSIRAQPSCAPGGRPACIRLSSWARRWTGRARTNTPTFTPPPFVPDAAPAAWRTRNTGWRSRTRRTSTFSTMARLRC